MLATMLPIMEVWCDEPRGPVLRVVSHVLEPNADYMRFLFSNMAGMPCMFTGGERLTNVESIRQTLVDQEWSLFQVDDVGLVAVGPMRTDFMADVHITFWDKRLRGREDLCRRVAEWVIAGFGLQSVFTAIPVSAKATIAFAKRVGFHTAEYHPGKGKDPAGEPDDALLMVFP